MIIRIFPVISRDHYTIHTVPAIHTIDLQYLGIPQAVAAFVILDPAKRVDPVLIETGPSSTLPALQAGLATLGVALADVKHALVTHIHLDHAGAAGHLAANGTHVHVHEFGARHLIDPGKLITSATRIYGDQMDRLWGTLKPVPESQVHPVRDNDIVETSGLRFRAIETPGHAKHHHAFALESQYEKVCFIGDAGGFNARAVSESFVSIPTPPPEFELESWLSSIDRLQRENFDALYLTHFGRVDDVDGHLRRLREILPQHANFVRERLAKEVPRDAILDEYIEWNRLDAAKHGIGEHDFARYISRNLLTMNVDGILRYWSKRESSSGA